MSKNYLSTKVAGADDDKISKERIFRFGYLTNEMAGVNGIRFLKLIETSGFERTSFDRFRVLELLEIEHRQMSSSQWNHLLQGLAHIPSK